MWCLDVHMKLRMGVSEHDEYPITLIGPKHWPPYHLAGKAKCCEILQFRLAFSFTLVLGGMEY